MRPSDVHWLDRVVFQIGRGGGLYRGGWGDRAAPDAFRSAVERRDEPIPAAPTLRRRLALGGVAAYDGWFESAAKGLPPESRRARVRVWLPPGRPRGVCVHLAAMGSELGWTRREWLAWPLLRDGIGAVLLEYAYYGSRRPPLRCFDGPADVGEQLRLNAAAVDEVSALLGWLRAEGHAVAVCGFSLGAVYAAYTAIRVPWPLPVVAAGVGASAGDLATRDLLSRQVCWPALGLSARRKLAEVFNGVALRTMRPPADPRLAQLIGLSRDGVVDPRDVRELHAHWAGSRLAWLDTGHVGGLLAGGEVLRGAIRAALPKNP